MQNGHDASPTKTEAEDRVILSFAYLLGIVAFAFLTAFSLAEPHAALQPLLAQLP